MKLAGSRCLVVGGARHLGGALALELAAAGAAVAVSSRSPEQAAAAAAAIESLGGRAVAASGDVTAPSEARRLVADAAAALGGLDVLLFAASGPFAPHRPEDLGDDEFAATFDVLARGFFATAVAAYRRFVSQAPEVGAGEVSPTGSRGVIVALTDPMGERPWAAFAAHGAAKAAQIMLVRQLALAWTDDGVRVCGVAPAPVDLPDDPHREASLRMAERFPTQRLIQPSEIAAAVRLCIEDDTLTGANLAVEGGESRT